MLVAIAANPQRVKCATDSNGTRLATSARDGGAFIAVEIFRRSPSPMPRSSLRACSVPGCPELTTGGKCTAHRRAAYRAADALRPSSSERGYDHDHQLLRKREDRRVQAGGVLCARCGLLIVPGSPWDLDHDDADRSRYLGPSHEACNRKTKTHQLEAHAR
jgi:hypothetical protein